MEYRAFVEYDRLDVNGFRVLHFGRNVLQLGLLYV